MQDDIIYYQNFFPSWVRAGTTTRKFGDVERQSNKNKLAKRLGISLNKLIFLQQQHSTKLLSFPRRRESIKINNYYMDPRLHGDDNEEIGDGLFTKEKNVALLIKTADCIPILLVETRKRIIMNLHAGRVGSLAEIVKRGVEKILENRGKASFIKVLFGPGIEEKCYTMDLATINKNQLLDLGVLEENILLNNDCTYCNRDLYFSYRRGDGTKRMGTFIYIDSRLRGNDTEKV